MTRQHATWRPALPGDTPGQLTPQLTLVEFVRQRLDEDERAARYVLSDYAEHGASWDCPSTGVVQLGDDLIAIGDGPVAYFIVRHDPARVLREVAAKRAILDRYEHAVAIADASRRYGVPAAQDVGYVVACLDLIRLLAQPYANHPGWREEWRVAG